MRERHRRTAAHAQARTPPDRRPRPRAALSPAGILKRRALERHLRGHGAEVLDQGAKHTKWRGPTGGALHRAAPQRDRSRRRGRHLRAARRSNAAQPALIPHRRRDRRLKAITTPTRRRASPDLRADPWAGRSGHAREGVTRPAPPQNPQSRGLGASATPEGASRAQPSRSAHDGEPDRYDIAALPLFVERFRPPRGRTAGPDDNLGIDGGWPTRWPRRGRGCPSCTARTRAASGWPVSGMMSC